jgi:sugar O-acyltransferase (sialic acid O-acetyltransferase NeuD family)
MSSRVGIFGTSGMARETRDIAHAVGLSVVYVARDTAELAAFQHKEEVILESAIGRYTDMPYIVGIGAGALRRKVATRYAGTLKFINLIHPSATFGHLQRAQVDQQQGVIISAGVRFTSNISVGDFTLFNLNATVSHDCIIADFVTVAPQACILGNVSIDSGAWIGAGATINQGDPASRRRIGANAVIGSGAVVIQNCSADSVYVGVPARKIK